MTATPRTTVAAPRTTRRFSRLRLLLLAAALGAIPAHAQQVIDLPTRPGVTQRLLVLAPANAKAAVILFTGGDGLLGLDATGRLQRGGNFLVRSRQLFADQGLVTVVVDAPSDKQRYPHLSGQRQNADHVADIRAVMDWLRGQHKLPLWLIGTSRGTQSAAFIATQLAPAEGGPDGIVLTATILRDPRSRAVPEMALEKLRIPVLVAHHRADECRVCLFSDMPLLMNRLAHLQRKDLLVFEGGLNVGDPCEARAWHGFNGIEQDVVAQIARWITAAP